MERATGVDRTLNVRARAGEDDVVDSSGASVRRLKTTWSGAIAAQVRRWERGTNSALGRPVLKTL